MSVAATRLFVLARLPRRFTPRSDGAGVCLHQSTANLFFRFLIQLTQVRQFFRYFTLKAARCGHIKLLRR
jgi:hypothetical protein